MMLGLGTVGCPLAPPHSKKVMGMKGSRGYIGSLRNVIERDARSYESALMGKGIYRAGTIEGWRSYIIAKD